MEQLFSYRGECPFIGKGGTSSTTLLPYFFYLHFCYVTTFEDNYLYEIYHLVFFLTLETASLQFLYL